MTGTNRNYYAQSLNSTKLFQVYQTQLPRVRQYLDAEVDFVRSELHGSEKVLELGAGYGRVMKNLAPHAASIWGIDISESSVEFGREYLKDIPNARIVVMDAHHLGFDERFDVVLCLQNGLSAMKGRAQDLVAQSLAVLANGGKAYFSTYSPKFWEHRLAWFQEQADKGLLGEIDPEKTTDGVIACKDGFVATTFAEADLEKLGKASGHRYQINEVDSSSVFLVITKG